jgi:hypothetical protein
MPSSFPNEERIEIQQVLLIVDNLVHIELCRIHSFRQVQKFRFVRPRAYLR